MDHTIFSFPIVIVIATPLSTGRGKRKDVQVLSVWKQWCKVDFSRHTAKAKTRENALASLLFWVYISDTACNTGFILVVNVPSIHTWGQLECTWRNQGETCAWDPKLPIAYWIQGTSGRKNTKHFQNNPGMCRHTKVLMGRVGTIPNEILISELAATGSLCNQWREK